MSVFIETAIHDGDPNTPVPKLETGLSVQTEREQAYGLIKTYAYGLSNRIDIILWNLIFKRTNYEQSCRTEPFPQNPFNHYGLIHNSMNEDGKSHKKLSCYTYKLMIEKLEGSDWDNIETIRESDNVYIYKFMKNGEPVWVAWWDYLTAQEAARQLQ